MIHPDNNGKWLIYTLNCVSFVKSKICVCVCASECRKFYHKLEQKLIKFVISSHVPCCADTKAILCYAQMKKKLYRNRCRKFNSVYSVTRSQNVSWELMSNGKWMDRFDWHKVSKSAFGLCKTKQNNREGEENNIGCIETMEQTISLNEYRV